jgi:PAS domain S-box-containing protein
VQHAVPNSAAELERLFELSLDLLCISGLDGYFKRVNPAFERTLGYTPEELLSRPFFDLVHPDDLASTRAAMEALSRGDEVVRFENRYVCKDGSERWLEWSVRPALEEGLLYGAARDVTERRLLADEQAALRRVATLVAQGATSNEVFHAVAAEIEQLMHADTGGLMRYEPDGTVTVLVNHSRGLMPIFQVGSRLSLDGDSLTARVRRTGLPARVESYDDVSGSISSKARDAGARSGVGAPVVVDGLLWGVMIAAWKRRTIMPPDIEARLAEFAELVGAAIANAHSRAELAASRARIVAASDETRRRIERDLYDGTQQRLVSLALALRAAEEKVPAGLEELREEISRVASGLARTVEELQEISRGLHPAILSSGGLIPALKALARQAAMPVELDVEAVRKLPDSIEVTAYYVVSEAIANAAKHAQAANVRVELHREGDTVRLSVHDDGVGGADPRRGSGLVGLRDRVEAAGGTMEVASYPGKGTSLHAAIPVGLS